MDRDIELIEDILMGNIDSFNILINKYELIVLRFVYGLIKDREAAEDITQETFITVYNKLYLFNKDYKFSSWILQIAKNKAIDYKRKFKRVYESNIEEAIALKSNDLSPEESAEYKEVKEEVRSYVDTLEEIDRQIILLRYSGERTFSDIADILGMNESTIKRKYYKAKERFMSQRRVANKMKGEV